MDLLLTLSPLLIFYFFLSLFFLPILSSRPDTLDPALLRPGRLDRRVEFGLPDNEGRAHILRIHARSMSVERDIRFDLIARLCPNTTGAELKSVATEAGMFAIRARRKMATEKDFLEAVDKVVRQGSKFSSTSLYAQVSFSSILMLDLLEGISTGKGFSLTDKSSLYLPPSRSPLSTSTIKNFSEIKSKTALEFSLGRLRMIWQCIVSLPIMNLFPNRSSCPLSGPEYPELNFPISFSSLVSLHIIKARGGVQDVVNRVV